MEAAFIQQQAGLERARLEKTINDPEVRQTLESFEEYVKANPEQFREFRAKMQAHDDYWIRKGYWDDRTDVPDHIQKRIEELRIEDAAKARYWATVQARKTEHWKAVASRIARVIELEKQAIAPERQQGPQWECFIGTMFLAASSIADYYADTDTEFTRNGFYEACGFTIIPPLISAGGFKHGEVKNG